MASIVNCYVGCSSGSPDEQAIHVLECDPESGAVRIVQSVRGVQGTTYFQIDSKGRNLYSIIGEKRNLKSVGSVVRFPISADGRLGEMRRIANLPCEAPCHISITPDEQRVAFAAYLSATAGTVGIDGRGLKVYVFPDDAMGSNELRQKKAYAHFTFYMPNKKHLGVIDLGCDRIRFFNPDTMEADAGLEIRAESSGDGPRHAIWSKNERFLFVLNELGSSITSYSFNGKAFSIVGKWTMLPEGYQRFESDGKTLATKAAAIKLTGDGKLLMASNRGHDSIAFYDVDNDTGRLTLRNIAKLRGRFPRDFELMPGEKFMIVGHKLSDEIQVYRFTRAVCTLEAVGAPIPVWHPLCFKFKEK